MTPDPLQVALAGLPHGPEFRFIDRLTSLENGRCATAQYTVRGDEPFLAGHFPGAPIFPGVLLVEAGAQLAGIVAQSQPSHPPHPALRLAGLRAVKILGTATPGQTIELRAELVQRLGNVVQARITACLAGKLIMQAEVTLSESASQTL